MDRRASRELIENLERDARLLAQRFGLRYRAIEAEHPRVKSHYGICYSDGTIRIRLRHAVTRKPLKYSSLVNTLCHELAHLRHFNHGPRFKALYLRILEYAREQRVYQPDPRRAAAPRPRPRPAPPVDRMAPVRAERTEAEAGPRAPEQLGLFG